ncbi:four-carbon acid sugar kinase family protein [Aureimonas sp. ME7]|uniref:four-carbon acid sugar kinase family protein n=1 Tax=Aureimonas sp. ME7 TaxID=2744252 RepID=UPI0015F47C0E|nr:four-carbon acid sugar kinase family protein [Aureimonas sp. ME7]
MFPSLRLMADDLTGALDSAAAFASPSMPVPVGWRSALAGRPGALALDTGTREVSAASAADIVRRLAGPFFSQSDALAFKKIDSLLRGSEAEEIDAILRERPFRHCVVAPAFPAQGRLTRGGRQGLSGPDGAFEPLAGDLGARLEAFGHRVRRTATGVPIEPGITLFDAETDADLDGIVGIDLDDVLWVGSAGLAGALARRRGASPSASGIDIAAPLLGLFGTDHPVMLGQLGAVADHRLELGEEDHDGVDALARRLAERGAAFVTVALPPGTDRGAAARRIAERFDALALRLDAPGTLVVAGGETLRSLCEGLGVDRLDVAGEVAPGIARSRLVGGRWDGTLTLSKSGAFGAPDFLQGLLAPVCGRPFGVRAP